MKAIKTTKSFALLITASALFSAQSLSGADANSGGWQFSTAPYIWGSGIDGDFHLGQRSIDIDIGFDDILDVTEYGFQTFLELRKEKFGFYANPSFLKLSGDAESDLGDAHFEQDFWVIEVGGFYNVINTAGETPFTLDVHAGARYWNIDTDFELDGVLGVQRNLGVTLEVIDPVVGLRMQYYLTEKFSLGFRGDVGGFGISEGETSDLSWQLTGLVGYDINDRFTAFAGYRAVGIDAVENDGGIERNMDIVFNGALLGLQINW